MTNQPQNQMEQLLWLNLKRLLIRRNILLKTSSLKSVIIFDFITVTYLVKKNIYWLHYWLHYALRPWSIALIYNIYIIYIYNIYIFIYLSIYLSIYKYIYGYEISMDGSEISILCVIATQLMRNLLPGSRVVSESILNNL